MDKRREELTKLKSYTEGIDSELTMILQSLQWDRKHLLQNPVMATCRYDSNHKVPPDKSEEHEKACFLKHNGYTKEDLLLPDPLNSESNTLVKLSNEDIQQIIGNACRSDPLFKKVYRNTVPGSELPHPFYIGVGCHGAEPMSLERLQSSYSADERRAIHDAVVSAVPSCHDLTDLALLSGGDDQSSKVILSRMEILVELRNMRRRRTKYRVAAKSRNYSDVLRDVIKTQMEHYSEGQSEIPPKENVGEQNDETDKQNYIGHSRQESRDDDRYKYQRHRQAVRRPINTEREDLAERNRDYSRENADMYTEGRRERRDRDRDRYIERTREKTSNEKSHMYQDQSRKRRREDFEEDYQYNERRTESKERRKADDKEYNDEERRGHKHRENDHQVKQEPGIDEDINNHHKERSRKRRHDENRDKIHKSRDRTIESQRRDRGRSSERRRDHRYDERSAETVYIKHEREDSATREGTSKKNKDKAKDKRRKSTERRHDRSYRDRNYDSHSSEKTVKKEKYDRYYDRFAEDVYDPNKIIKVEK